MPFPSPFTYRVLLSGDTQLCASLISDGFDEEPADQKTKLYAISGDFDAGFARLKRFISLVRLLAPSNPALNDGLGETLEFLESKRDRYALLETVELDIMTCASPDELKASVEQELAECVKAGAAIDALPAEPAEAAAILSNATRNRAASPLDAFYGLRFDDDFDNTPDDNDMPLGLEWSDALYYTLWNRAKFEANRK
jgi:hypothetical protein